MKVDIRGLEVPFFKSVKDNSNAPPKEKEEFSFEDEEDESED